MGSKLIAVVGTVNIDTTLIVKRVPDPGESVRAQDYVQSCGGKGANSAIASFRSSHVREVLPRDEGDNDAPRFVDRNVFEGSDEIKVKLIAAIGDDDNGKICRENLERNGIDTSGFQQVPNSMTGLSFCVVEEATGQNRVMSHRGANDLHKIDNYQEPTFLQGVDLLISHLALPLQVVEQILETAGKAKVEILLNAAPAQTFYRKIWKNLTHLIVNETEAGILSGRPASEVNVESCPKIAEMFLKKGVKNVVITLGESGAYFATRDVSRTMIAGHVKAHAVDVKDTTGAGDTFVGAYASHYLHQKSQGRWDIREAVERARSASSWTIGEIGAQAAIPWADQIDQVNLKHGTTENDVEDDIHSVIQPLSMED